MEVDQYCSQLLQEDQGHKIRVRPFFFKFFKTRLSYTNPDVFFNLKPCLIYGDSLLTGTIEFLPLKRPRSFFVILVLFRVTSGTV